MNRCSKSGIHEHSPKSQIHIQIIHRIAKLSSIDFPDHGEDVFQKRRCARRYLEVVVPCRFCILLTCQLKNWLRVQGVELKLYWFGQQVLLCSTKSQDCRSLPNLLLLDATGFTAAFPSTHQGMHPLVALEKSTLRRMSFGSTLILSSFPEAIGIPGLSDAVGLDVVKELVAVKEDRFIAAGRDLNTTLSSSF